MFNLKSLNKIAAKHDLELVKGDGYFWWAHESTSIDSVYICHFSHADKQWWLEELDRAIGQIEELELV